MTMTFDLQAGSRDMIPSCQDEFDQDQLHRLVVCVMDFIRHLLNSTGEKLISVQSPLERPMFLVAI